MRSTLWALCAALLMLAAGTAFADDFWCDLDYDGDVDRVDVQIITQGRGLYAPGDPRDVDGNGYITVGDARACVLVCTRANCATQ